MKYLVLLAVVFLAGCQPTRTTVEDNRPDRRERIYAWEACAGGRMSQYSDLAFDVRLACTQAVYGGGTK